MNFLFSNPNQNLGQALQKDDPLCKMILGMDNDYKNFSIKDGVVLIQTIIGNEQSWRILVPSNRLVSLVAFIHCQKNHLSLTDFIRFFQERYFNPDFKIKIKEFGRNCPFCILLGGYGQLKLSHFERVIVGNQTRQRFDEIFALTARSSHSRSVLNVLREVVKVILKISYLTKLERSKCVNPKSGCSI